jgi:hypothetical protein
VISSIKQSTLKGLNDDENDAKKKSFGGRSCGGVYTIWLCEYWQYHSKCFWK